MSLATDRESRHKARFAADRFEEIEARLAFLEDAVEQYEEKEKLAKATRKRKAVPVASYGARPHSAAKLLAKGYTIDALDVNTGDLKLSQPPKRA